MHIMRVWMAVLAIAVLVLSITLAQGSGVVGVLANVSPATDFSIPEGTTVELQPQSGQIGIWSNTFGLDFLENSPNALLAQCSDDGHLVTNYNNAWVRMTNQLRVNDHPVSSDSTYVGEIFFNIGEDGMDLPLSQEVTFNDPASVYEGTLTLTLSPDIPLTG